jgi:hypothetical protein
MEGGRVGADAGKHAWRDLAEKRLDCWSRDAENSSVYLDGGPDVDVVGVPWDIEASFDAEDADYSDDGC